MFQTTPSPDDRRKSDPPLTESVRTALDSIASIVLSREPLTKQHLPALWTLKAELPDKAVIFDLLRQTTKENHRFYLLDVCYGSKSPIVQAAATAMTIYYCARGFQWNAITHGPWMDSKPRKVLVKATKIAGSGPPEPAIALAKRLIHWDGEQPLGKLFAGVSSPATEQWIQSATDLLKLATVGTTPQAIVQYAALDILYSIRLGLLDDKQHALMCDAETAALGAITSLNPVFEIGDREPLPSNVAMKAAGVLESTKIRSQHVIEKLSKLVSDRKQPYEVRTAAAHSFESTSEGVAALVGCAGEWGPMLSRNSYREFVATCVYVANSRRRRDQQTRMGW